jgi:hypothetical protein
VGDMAHCLAVESCRAGPGEARWCGSKSNRPGASGNKGDQRGQAGFGPTRTGPAAQEAAAPAAQRRSAWLLMRSEIRTS